MEKLIFITPSNNFINWLGQLSCSIPNQHDFWGWQQRKLTLTKGRWSSFWEVMFSCKNGFSAIRSKSHTSKVLHGLEILQCSFLGFVFFSLFTKPWCTGKHILEVSLKLIVVQLAKTEYFTEQLHLSSLNTIPEDNEIMKDHQRLSKCRLCSCKMKFGATGVLAVNLRV